ncbi:phosphatase PAP2 family protein [Candidatus Bipolaricaulota bacterium]
MLVAWSRVLLGVHRPEDVVWGGLLGMLLGVVAVWLSYRLLRNRKMPIEAGMTQVPLA